MLNAKAVITALLTGAVGSLAALVVVVLLSQATSPVHGLWFVGLGLVLAFTGPTAFFVARIARRHELVHAAFAGSVFVVLSYLLYPGADFNDAIPGGVDSRLVSPTPGWHDVVVYGLIALIFPIALIGGYVARAKASNRQPWLLGRLAYGAMAVWGITETFDSVPGLFGTYFVGILGLVPPLALLLAIVSSIGLAGLAPGQSRRRVVAWYCLLMLVAVATSVGTAPRLVAEIIAAAVPSLWFVSSIRDTPSLEHATSAQALSE